MYKNSRHIVWEKDPSGVIGRLRDHTGYYVRVKLWCNGEGKMVYRLASIHRIERPTTHYSAAEAVEEAARILDDWRGGLVLVDERKAKIQAAEAEMHELLGLR